MTNLAAALTLAFAGPGRYSLDRAFGLRTPRWMAAFVTLGTMGATYLALNRPEERPKQ